MNTRLQVEHPVTEMITGVDLVEWQVLIAQGERLPMLQSQLKSSGHAMEFRLYAEDPVRFLPSPGKISKLVWEETPGIRIDAGYQEGDTVTPYYDPMIAKCIFHGETRSEVMEAAEEFFKTLQIDGIKTNAPLFTKILLNDDFVKGIYTTNFLSKKLVK
jgi:acetyl-CoA carboxylase biotin carboxylase subunit